MRDNHVDVTIIVALLAITAVSIVSIVFGGAAGLTVAAGGLGGIAGWMTRGSKLADKITNSTGDNATVQPDAGGSS